MPRSSAETARLAELIDATGTLRRVLRARMRAAWPYDELPTGQLDLLRLLVESPGLLVGEAADALAIAPNSVSTMVRTLGDAGLLERRRDPDDGRAARLHAAPTAARRLRRWRARRAELLARAVGALSTADREALHAAVEPLQRLCAALASTGEIRAAAD